MIQAKKLKWDDDDDGDDVIGSDGLVGKYLIAEIYDGRDAFYYELLPSTESGTRKTLKGAKNAAQKLFDRFVKAVAEEVEEATTKPNPPKSRIVKGGVDPRKGKGK